MSEYDRIIIGEQYQKIAEINKELNQQVIRDRLTGLFNRSYLETALKEQFQTVQEKLGNIECMMIDMDYFKQYNDRFGQYIRRPVPENFRRLPGEGSAEQVRKPDPLWRRRISRILIWAGC